MTTFSNHTPKSRCAGFALIKPLLFVVVFSGLLALLVPLYVSVMAYVASLS